MNAIRVGVDVGGTFTDLCAWDGESWRRVKLPTTPDDYTRAIADGLERLRLPPQYSLVVGTTVATNALLERRGDRVAFVATAGFRDLLHIGRQDRPALYDWSVQKPRPLAAREDCCELSERVAADGAVLSPLSDAECDALARELAGRGVETVAVCLLFAHLNPRHELQFARAAEAAGLRICLSSAVAPEFREFERASTTVVNAFVTGPMQRFCAHLEGAARGAGAASVRIMQSSGGQAAVPHAARFPVQTVLSGPAGGAIAALRAARQAGIPRVLSYDMGGTSTDVALLDDRLPFSAQSALDGWPIRAPQIAIHTVGRGGGSIASVDLAGALAVGPESAGAIPGPACYGRGTRPTITDANLVLGRLRPDRFLGGAMRLDLQRANVALAPLAAAMGCDLAAAARSVIDVGNAGMEHALQVVSSRCGHDPADYWLLSFGGAGGLHAVALAESLGLPGVLVPPDPGILSASGMVLADSLYDAARSLPLDGVLDLRRLQAVFGELMDLVADRLVRDGHDIDDAVCERLVDVRYVGQAHEITVPLQSQTDAVRLAAPFHAAHQRLFGTSDATEPVEVVTARVRSVVATQPIPPRPLAPATAVEPPVAEWAEVQFDRPQRTAIVSRDQLQAGHCVAGPAIVVEDHATLLVPPSWRARVEPEGHLRVTRGAS
ncbi:MAG: hydantoinase/oxoprolinase family protein [Phycisphaerae bacterium]